MKECIRLKHVLTYFTDHYKFMETKVQMFYYLWPIKALFKKKIKLGNNEYFSYFYKAFIAPKFSKTILRSVPHSWKFCDLGHLVLSLPFQHDWFSCKQWCLNVLQTVVHFLKEVTIGVITSRGSLFWHFHKFAEGRGHDD